MLRKFRFFSLIKSPLFILGLLVVGILSFSIIHATPQLPSSHHPHLFYSNQCRDDLTSLYKCAIKNAKKSIYLAIYGFTESSLIEALNQKAEEGITISVLYDPSASSFLTKKLNPLIKTQAYKGSGLMHRKILIIDHKKILLGTANLTPSSLKYHGNLVVGIYSASLASCLEDPRKRQCDCVLPLGKISVELLPDHYDFSLNKIRECIRLSRKTCYVAMYTFTHPVLTNDLIQAKLRGVDVRVVMDGSSCQGASYSTYQKLKENNIYVLQSRGPELLHHKWVWIDGTDLIVGSTNWTRSAFKKNHDCFLMLRDLDKESQAKLEKLWHILELEAH